MAADILPLVKGAKFDAIQLKEHRNPLVWISGLLKQYQEQGQGIEELHLMAHGSADGLRLCKQLINNNLSRQLQSLLSLTIPIVAIRI